MPHRLDSLYNEANKLRTAAMFPGFFLRWPQVLAAEAWARLVAPTSWPSAVMLPKSIVVRMTERCFLRCAFCAQGGESARVDKGRRDDDFIGRDTLAKIGQEAAGWPIKPLIMLTGGEPLMYWEDLLEAVQGMRARGLTVMFNTNGMLLQNERVARRVVESDVNCISVSIDGSREVHNRLRGNPRLFDAIVRGIENVRAFRRQLGRKGPAITVTMVVASLTQHEIEHVYDLALAMKADWFNLQYLNYTTPETCTQAHLFARNRLGAGETPWPWASFCNPRFNDLDPDAVAEQLTRVFARRGRVPIYVLGGLTSSRQIASYYHTSEPIRDSLCAVPFTAIHIVMPGKATFCIDYPAYEYGDIRHGTLESAWFGAAANRFRRELVAHFRSCGRNLPQCQRCCWRFT